MPRLDRLEHRVHQLAALLERAPLHDEDELRVARRAVVVHAELARLHAALAQRHALGVPERDDGVDLPGDQARHGREADRDLLHAVVVAAVVLDHGAEHGLVRGQARHAHALSLEVARPADVAGARDHGRERALHQRADPDHVAARLAREAEVVDVHDRHVGPARREQLQRVGARRGHADLQVGRRRCPAWTAFGWKSSAIVPARWCPPESPPPQPARHANTSAMGRNLRTAAKSRGERCTCHGGDRSAGPWARRLYRRVHRHAVARLLRHGRGVAVRDAAEPAEPESVHRLLGDRARARLPAVRPDPDARGHLRRALQPGGDRRP